MKIIFLEETLKTYSGFMVRKINKLTIPKGKTYFRNYIVDVELTALHRANT